MQSTKELPIFIVSNSPSITPFTPITCGASGLHSCPHAPLYISHFNAKHFFFYLPLTKNLDLNRRTECNLFFFSDAHKAINSFVFAVSASLEVPHEPSAAHRGEKQESQRFLYAQCDAAFPPANLHLHRFDLCGGGVGGGTGGCTLSSLTLSVCAFVGRAVGVSGEPAWIGGLGDAAVNRGRATRSIAAPPLLRGQLRDCAPPK